MPPTYPLHLASPEVRKAVRHDVDIPDLEPLHEQRRLNLRLQTEPDITIEYDIYGPDDAPEKIVFVMGFTGTRNEWARTINDIFRVQPNTFQVLLLDNRGVGGSSAPTGR